LDCIEAFFLKPKAFERRAEMKHTIALSLLLFTLLMGGCKSSSNPEAEQAAITAANEWLSLVDAADYSKSWDEAAAFF
jgi:hypothetical protein